MPDKEKVLAKFAQVLDNQWLTNMGLVLRIGRPHCYYAWSEALYLRLQCHHWLELLQRALNLKVKSLSRPLPSLPLLTLRWQRIDPVFCDVRMEDHLIDHTKIEALITPRTSAILAVPYLGATITNTLPYNQSQISTVSN